MVLKFIWKKTNDLVYYNKDCTGKGKNNNKVIHFVEVSTLPDSRFTTK